MIRKIHLILLSTLSLRSIHFTNNVIPRVVEIFIINKCGDEETVKWRDKTCPVLPLFIIDKRRIVERYRCRLHTFLGGAIWRKYWSFSGIVDTEKHGYVERFLIESKIWCRLTGKEISGLNGGNPSIDISRWKACQSFVRTG